MESTNQSLKQYWRRSSLAELLARCVRCIPNVPESIWKHLAFEAPFTVTLPDDKEFLLLHGGHRVENEIFWCGIFGQWERFSLRLWYDQAKTADCILDAAFEFILFFLDSSIHLTKLSSIILCFYIRHEIFCAYLFR